MDQPFSRGLSNKPISGRLSALSTLIRLAGGFDAIRFLWARAFHQREVLLSLKPTRTKIKLRPRKFEEDCSWIDSIDVLVVELHGSKKKRSD